MSEKEAKRTVVNGKERAPRVLPMSVAGEGEERQSGEGGGEKIENEPPPSSSSSDGEK